MTVPISDEELDHQRDVLQAMMDHGIPMGDGGIAKALAVIERLDQAERENVHLRKLVNEYVGITPLARIAQLESALLHDRTVIERVVRDESGSQWLVDTLSKISTRCWGSRD